MKTKHHPVVPTIIAFAAALNLPVQAKSWPPLKDFVSNGVLVVKARQAGEFPPRKGDKLSFEIPESWKGHFDPRDFTEICLEGYNQAWPGEHGMNVVAGQEIVFYFSRHNQPVEVKLTQHGTAFPINRGRIVYAISGNPGESQEMSVDEFKRILAAANEPERAAPRQIRFSSTPTPVQVTTCRTRRLLPMPR